MQQGDFFGFTWLNGTVISYDDIEFTDQLYCTADVRPNVGDVFDFDVLTNRKYSVSYSTEACSTHSYQEECCKCFTAKI